jgi:hypothetical protein
MNAPTPRDVFDSLASCRVASWTLEAAPTYAGSMQPWVSGLIALVGTLASATVSLPAGATCGERGGPGYRGPDGKCVGWANIGKVCGNPPSTHCTAELAHANAPDAAGHGVAIE